MPLNTTQAENQVLALLDDMATRTADPDRARRDFARQLVGIMAAMVRTATITGTVTTTVAGTPTIGTITTATIS